MMKTAVKNVLLTKIQNIYEISKKSELDDKIILSLKADLKIVSTYLSVEPREALFFSVILNINFDGDNANFRDLFRHFNIPSIQMISEMEYINNLVNKGYLVKKNGRDRNNEVLTNKYFISFNSKKRFRGIGYSNKFSIYHFRTGKNTLLL